MWAEINSIFKAMVNSTVKVNTKTACKEVGLQRLTNESKSLRLEYVCGAGHQPAIPSLLTCHVTYVNLSSCKVILRKLIIFPLNLLQLKHGGLYETTLPGTVRFIYKWLNKTMTLSNHP